MVERLKENWLEALGVVLLVVAVFIGIYVYKATEEQKVTTESQLEAQTTAGVQRAATSAGLTLQPTQAKEVAKEVERIYTQQVEPIYIVTTNGAEAKQEATKAQETAKADFAIVTDRNNLEVAVELDELPKDAKVELNQYNVQAYKSVLRSVSVTPRINGGGGIGVVGVSVAKKVTKDGQYIGLGVEYNFDTHKTYAKVMYTW